MAPRKAKPKVSTEVPFVPANVRETRSKGRERSAGAAAPATGSSATYRVKKYNNGMLSLAETPEHLVSIAQRNATDSLLLRLPPEVRLTIWRYILGDELVQLPWYRQRGYAVRYERDRSFSEHGLIPSYLVRRIEKVSSAFCLPQVCRQIYSETAFVAFSSSTFILSSDYRYYDTAILRLKPAQRRAITSIQPQHDALKMSVSNTEHWRYKMPYATYKPFKRTFFPNLKTIVVSKLAFKYVQQEMSRERGLNLSENEWMQWLTQALKQREGEEIKVEFKDPDPSW